MSSVVNFESDQAESFWYYSIQPSQQPDYLRTARSQKETEVADQTANVKTEE